MYFETHIFCCLNSKEAPKSGCFEKGSDELQAYFKTKLKEHGIRHARVNKSGCLGRCKLGPCVVVYPEGVWYSPKTTGDIDEIIQSHLLGGKPVERLRLPDSPESL